MATRHKGIIAYGTDEDRKKLAVISDAMGRSGSEQIIHLIRHTYAEVFGETDPDDILKNH